MANTKNKPLFIDHLRYQVIGTKDGKTLPQNWPSLAREFTCRHSIESARVTANNRDILNRKEGIKFVVVDRQTGEII